MASLVYLRDRIARVPSPRISVSQDVDAGLDASMRYLASDAAERSITASIYWPKWDSPWWHMLLAFELGEAHRIPERTVRHMLLGVQAAPVKIFEIRPEDVPAGVGSDSPRLCHCQLASVYQLLAACGVDVRAELPWFEPWFIRCQMSDGGLNCDETAYLVEGECPSSMVGTVSPLEAMLLGGATAERATFVDRAAAFMIERRLMLGSQTQHNASEGARAPLSKQPCFPRFYLYDVLRGLSALLGWAECRAADIPAFALEPVVEHLLDAFPDGVVRLQRRSYDGVRTRARDSAGRSVRVPASRFPLLDDSSRIGDASPALTRQWSAARQLLLELIEEKRIVA